MWDAQAAALADSGHDVLTPDLPGFGASPLPVGEPDLDTVAAALLDVLDDAGIDRCAVAGLSLGGYLAMAMLRLARRRFSSLMLVDTKASLDSPPALQNRLLVAEKVVREADTGFLVPAMLPGLLGDTSRESRPDVVARTEGWIRGAAPESVAWYQRAMARRPDSIPDLRRFTGPALVLYGDEDSVLSPYPEQRAMADALADSRLRSVVAAGHLSAVEQPAAVAQEMKEFLAERGAA
jgi:pimeloyl-ACP methyl ester carboxylesterase